MSEEKVLVSIAARAGSKGVSGKNLKLLNGKPLISYAIKAALNAKLVNKVVVSTEDDKIAEVAESLGATAPFRRLMSLAGDREPLVSVTRNTMEEMDKLGFRASIIVQLSPTCPFITSDIIDKTIETVANADSAVTLKRIEHEHPYRAKEIFNENNFRSFIKDIDVEKFQSRQDLPELYCTCGAIYTRKRYILETATGKDFAFGKITRGVFLSDTEAINIDRPIDFIFADFIMTNYDKFKKEGMIK